MNGRIGWAMLRSFLMRGISLCLCVSGVGLAGIFSVDAYAETFTAKVIEVLDGDTVLVLRGNQKIKIRMANIDAPEKAQEGGMESKQSLLDMVMHKQVQIDSQTVDDYGRVVGTISLDGKNINEEQVRRGMAWEYSNYHSNKTYIALQSEAQAARRGLWNQASPLPPWQWRKLHAADAPHRPAEPLPVVAGDFTCGSKRHCSQMTSCAEAHFYLASCKVKSLDADGDGTPCESLCNTGKKITR